MKIKTNIYWASIYQLSLPLIILWLSRIAFYLSNKEIIGEIPTQNLIALMGHGISFDILPLIYFNLVWIIMRFLPFDFTSKRYTIFLHQHYSTYFKFRRHYLHQIQWSQTKIHNTKWTIQRWCNWEYISLLYDWILACFFLGNNNSYHPILAIQQSWNNPL